MAKSPSTAFMAPATKVAAPKRSKAADRAAAAAAPSIPQIAVQTVLMTPELATGYLARNTRNRPVRKSRVERYARDMREGRWQLNGETIIVSDEGNLMNGQHRLEAVVRSEVSVPMMVTSGIPEIAFSTMDAGLSRTAGDVLQMKGVLNFNQVAAVTRMCLNYKDGMPLSTTRAISEIQKAVEDHPEIEAFVSSHNKIYNLARNSAVIAVCYLAQRFGEESDPERTVDDFVRGVVTGSNLEEADARLTYRNKILGMASDKMRRPEQAAIWYFTSRALTHYLNGTPIMKLVPGRGETPHFSEIPTAPRARVAEMWNDPAPASQD